MEDFDIDLLDEVHEEEGTGDILFTARRSDGALVTGRISRAAGGLFASAIASVLGKSKRPFLAPGRAQFPTVRQSRPVVSEDGHPCIELRLIERFPIVFQIQAGAAPALCRTISQVEELRRALDEKPRSKKH